MGLSKFILFAITGFFCLGFSPLFGEEMLQLKEEQPRLILADAKVSSNDSLNVNDLGFTQADLQSDLSQKDLDTREDMLKIHQILGVITAVPLLSEFVVGIATANNVANGSTDTSLVSTLGWTTLVFYSATASFEIFAPKPKNKKKTGNTGIHEALSWIHLPLMILVPLTGDMLDDRIANHQPLGNLPVVHGVMATTLVLAYMTSLTVITF
jgi:hypothetical protein